MAAPNAQQGLPIFEIFTFLPKTSDPDRWAGICMRFGLREPWFWGGPEFGWLPSYGIGQPQPWWKVLSVTSEQASRLLSGPRRLKREAVDVFRVSDLPFTSLADEGLTDEVLASVGLRRTGLVFSSNDSVSDREFDEDYAAELALNGSPRDLSRPSPSKISQPLFQPRQQRSVPNSLTEDAAPPGQKKVPAERIEFIRKAEQSLGISIDRCSAITDGADIDLSVLGEVSATSHDGRDFEIVAAIYDSAGDLIDEQTHVVDAEHFGGFDTFKIMFFSLLSEPRRILVFPRPFG